ncbi:hypothetical protein KSP40_PGU020989 [Platanthera guangdongensis]|uniref:Uncharacterized protein n=1 Tax=Platanthera guangdongensis TaxID=2320717 RepID=A0ABR2LTV8_9ASPA
MMSSDLQGQVSDLARRMNTMEASIETPFELHGYHREGEAFVRTATPTARDARGRPRNPPARAARGRPRNPTLVDTIPTTIVPDDNGRFLSNTSSPFQGNTPSSPIFTTIVPPDDGWLLQNTFSPFQNNTSAPPTHTTIVPPDNGRLLPNTSSPSQGNTPASPIPTNIVPPDDGQLLSNTSSPSQNNTSAPTNDPAGVGAIVICSDRVTDPTVPLSDHQPVAQSAPRRYETRFTWAANNPAAHSSLATQSQPPTEHAITTRRTPSRGRQPRRSTRTTPARNVSALSDLIRKLSEEIKELSKKVARDIKQLSIKVNKNTQQVTRTAQKVTRTAQQVTRTAQQVTGNAQRNAQEVKALKASIRAHEVLLSQIRR